MKSVKRIKFSFIKAGIFLIFAVLLFLLIAGILRQNRAGDREFLAPVIIVRPRRGAIEKRLGLTSRVETGRLITVVPRTAGTLEMLDADPGREVSRNEVLARIDSSPYDQTFLQAQAAYLTARSTFDRVSKLYENQAATLQQFEEARALHESARAQFELARLNRDYTLIRSPMDGVVLIRHATAGAIVNAGSPLFTLGDPGDLRIKAAVPEVHYRFFAERWETMTVRLRAPALGDEEFLLTPLSLAPYVSPENRSFIVEYAVSGGDERFLKPGMFVNVSFILESLEDVWHLPFRTLASGGRLWYADGEDRARYIEFTPDFFNEELFRIPDEYGEWRFIIEGQHFISPGQKLNILQETSP
ncbi:MAG: efflux RND transporter periplasmic adaptor subunit [Treponema sp.]|jgi:RND family efflux transporter MFP subunit|nr:efflux RND transporter periplasmic adaptor subunit [Treponema sp.]